MTDDWPRPVVHWEIVAQDPLRQAAFYRALCHREIGGGPTVAAIEDPEGLSLVLVQQ